MLIYFGMGLFQLAAIASAFEEWTNLPFIITFIPAILLAYIPVIGVIVGIMGAVQAWGWSLTASIGLFVAPYIIGVILSTILNIILGKSKRSGVDTGSI